MDKKVKKDSPRILKRVYVTAVKLMHAKVAKKNASESEKAARTELENNREYISFKEKGKTKYTVLEGSEGKVKLEYRTSTRKNIKDDAPAILRKKLGDEAEKYIKTIETVDKDCIDMLIANNHAKEADELYEKKESEALYLKSLGDAKEV